MSATSFLLRLQPFTVALICIAMLAGHSHPSIAAVGSLAIIALLPWTIASCIVWAFGTGAVPRSTAFWLLISALAVYTGLSAVGGEASGNAIRISQLALVVGTLFSFFHWSRYANARDRRKLFRVGSWALTALLIDTVLSWVGFESFGMANPNGLAITALSLLGMVVYFGLQSGVPKQQLYFVGATAIFLIAVSGSRSVLMALTMATVALMCMRAARRLPFLSGVIFVAVLTPSFLLSYLTMFPDGELANWVNSVSNDMFGKRLSSGRGDIWSPVLAHTNWAIGAGPGSHPSEVTGSGLSAHNWYLQSLYQVGLLGTVPVVLAVLVLWFRSAHAKLVPAARWAAAFVAAILSVQFFEVSLTQNHLATAIPFWVVAGDALRRMQVTVGLPTDTKQSPSLSR